MKKNHLLFSAIFLLITTQKLFAQSSPGNVGTTNLSAWFNPDILPLGNATSWPTTFPTGSSVLTLNDLNTPYPTVTNTPANNISNYNKTISFIGNTVAAPMSLELPGTLNLLDNAVSTSQGTLFAVYYMNTTATAAQQVVDYRESGGDAIQLRWLTATNSRLALGTSNSTNGTRDYTEGGRPMILSYSGNKSGATTLKCRKKSLEWTNAPTASSASTSAQLGLTIGARKSTAGVYSGMCESYISEIIFFKNNLTLAENLQVESYLALKYGITLDATASSTGKYLASNASEIWNSAGVTSYHNDVIGIGRDDNTSLTQKQSHTFDDSTRIYISYLATSNLLNIGTFSNNVSYVTLGNNLAASNETASASIEIPSGQNILNRIAREWRVTNTNMSNTFSLDIKLSSFTNFTTNPANLCLLVDDDGNFTNASVFQSGLTFSVLGNVVTISGISNTQIPLNSTKYLTLAYINSNITPIAGTTASTDTTLCLGSPFTFSLAGASTFTGQNYQWESSIDDITYSPISGANSSTHLVSATSNLYYHCIITLGSNTSTSSSLLITVDTLPTISATSTASSICNGQSVTLNGTGATTLSWNNSVNNNVPFTPSTTLIYIVTGTDGNNCSNTATVQVVVNNLPNVTISTTANSLCIGQSVTLSGNGSNSYSWNNSVLDNVSFSPTSTQTYQVTGTDANSCSNTATIQIVVNQLPNVTANATTDTICNGNSTILTGGGGNSYVWNNSVVDNISFSPTSTQTYQVTGTDANSCSNTASIQIVVNQLPNITANATTDTICNGNSTILTGGGGNSYVWNNSVLDNVSFSPTSTQTYQVTGTDANSCSNTAIIQIVVNQMPNITANATTDTICNGNSTILTGGGGNSYVWNNSVLDNVSFSPTYTQTYQVTGTDANSCSNTATIQIVVNQLPNVTANATTDTICNGNSTILTGGGGNSYVWNNSVLDNVSFSPTSTQTYQVTGTDANSCSNTASILVVVDTLPVIGAFASFSTICQGEQTSLHGSGANTYTWTDGTNTYTNATNFTPSAKATYIVTGTDSHNCSGTSSVTVNIQSLPSINATATNTSICNGNSTDIHATGGISYIWNNAITDSVQTVLPSTSTNYSVIGFDGACYNTANVTVTVNTLSTFLAMTTSNNSNNQTDGTTIYYTNPSCDLIAKLNDGNGGTVLGNTISTVNISPSIGVYNNQPYVRRWYEITPTNNGAAIVTLYLTQADFDDYNSNNGAFLDLPTLGNNADPNIANIRITKVDGALGIGTPLVITPTMNWNGNYWEATFSVSSFSQFYFHSVNPLNSALPATIINFNAVKDENKDDISWTTVNEFNNNYFNVLYSTNGVDYKSISKSESKAINGNSQLELNYLIENIETQLGHNYYKLQQIDFDGKSTIYNQVLDVYRSQNGSTVSVYPNPATDIINIKMYNTAATKTTIQLVDMSGRKLKEIATTNSIGNNEIALDIQDVSTGLYLIQVLENGKLVSSNKIRK